MNRLLSSALIALLALIFGFLGAWAFTLSPLHSSATRTWLVENPDILPEMAQALQEHDSARQLAGIRGEVEKPFPGAVLGNPNGTVTLVEFSDYGCTFCRHSVEDVKKLIAANPDLRVVIREWPIFDGSEAAARMALVAAKQGKFAAFHDAMFASGPPSAATIAAAAEKAEIDMKAAKVQGVAQDVTYELQKNHQLAQQLRFEGTPAWVVGNQVIGGAVGEANLAKAVEAARKATPDK